LTHLYLERRGGEGTVNASSFPKGEKEKEKQAVSLGEKGEGRR